MKLYTTDQRLGHLAVYLIAVDKPFIFNGTAIQFFASEDFFRFLFAQDPTLSEIHFDIL